MEHIVHICVSLLLVLCCIYFALHQNNKNQSLLPMSFSLVDKLNQSDSSCVIHTREVSSTTAKIHIGCLVTVLDFHLKCNFAHGKRLTTPDQTIYSDQPEFVVLSNLVPGKKYMCTGFSGATTKFNTLPAEPIPNNVFSVWIPGVNDYDPLPVEYTCLSGYEKFSPSPPLKWANAPAGTREFMLTFAENDPLNGVRYEWVLFNISGNTSSLQQNTTLGIAAGTDGGGEHSRIYRYWPPCSAGAGWRPVTLTLYSLSTSLVEILGNPFDILATDAEVAVDFVNTQNITLSRAFFSVLWCHYEC